VRVTFNNPPLNVTGPEFVLEVREILNNLEADEQVKVVVFDGTCTSPSPTPPVSRDESRRSSWTSA
jgi:hypothetical protein